MIDSVNYIIHNIRHVDFEHLQLLGITDIKTYKRKTLNCATYTDYRWSYKSIEFKFSPFFGTVLLLTNTHKLLEPKVDITLADKELFEEQVYEVVHEVFKEQIINLELDRIDYYTDVKTSGFNEMLLYMRMYEFQMPKLGHATIKEKYLTSLHRSSKRGQYNFNAYAKDVESNDERYKNVLRIELQMKRAKIKKESKIGVARELINYWNSNAMEEYYFNLYRELFGYGMHMKYAKAKEIINASNYSTLWKKKLFNFLKKRMKCFDWKEIVKTKRTYLSYVDKLKSLNINVLCIPKELESLVGDADGVENLLDKAHKVAEKKIFYLDGYYIYNYILYLQF